MYQFWSRRFFTKVRMVLNRIVGGVKKCEHHASSSAYCLETRGEYHYHVLWVSKFARHCKRYESYVGRNVKREPLQWHTYFFFYIIYFPPGQKFVVHNFVLPLVGNRTIDHPSRSLPHNFVLPLVRNRTGNHPSRSPPPSPTTTPAQEFAARIKYINTLHLAAFLTTRLH